MEAIGKLIRDTRLRKGLRSDLMRIRLKQSVAGYSRIERGLQKPTEEEIKILESLFGEKLVIEHGAYAGKFYGYMLLLGDITDRSVRPYYFPIEVEAERADKNGVYRLKTIEKIHDDIMEILEKLDEDTSLEGITFMGEVSTMKDEE